MLLYRWLTNFEVSIFVFDVGTSTIPPLLVLFSSQTPRLRAAVDFYLDFVGGRYHGGLKIPELDVG